MEQAVIAGVGNIYRAEILFKAGVHPVRLGLLALDLHLLLHFLFGTV